ncbi:uncharacterized protein [Chelonus insularis]|uniref:uncharacterized protein n=1 Tax=Chelonus insularis TaxID=460826 RepID=UPI00158D1753|nr:uncharacterized protein LOC118070074 [Chelonus insularis]
MLPQIKNHEDIRELLTKFWVQEEVFISNQHQLSSLYQQCEDFFKSTHSRHLSGRYIVRIPLISLPAASGDSYTTAYRCLKRQLRRLTNESEYSNLYRQFMTEYEELGYMRPASTINRESQDIHPYFLSLHGVLRPSSTTTKLRVICNGSSPCSTGVSLNDITHTEAKIQLDMRAASPLQNGNSQSLLQKTSQSSFNQDKITFKDCNAKILGLQ